MKKSDKKSSNYNRHSWRDRVRREEKDVFGVYCLDGEDLEPQETFGSFGAALDYLISEMSCEFPWNDALSVHSAVGNSLDEYYRIFTDQAFLRERLDVWAVFYLDSGASFTYTVELLPKFEDEGE